MKLRTGEVYVNNRFAGLLEETETGYQFTYDTDYLHSKNPLAVSLTLPFNQSPYHSNVLFPFFDGLIPEGWLLSIAVDHWKLNYADRFGILLATSKDPIGNVSVKARE